MLRHYNKGFPLFQSYIIIRAAKEYNDLNLLIKEV